MPIISVIVPVYNVERYLPMCIESILKQNFTDFELILVNDGSQDSSLEICQRYAQSDKRIVLLTQTNKGVSSARNVAIGIAKGKYLTFVDADDFVEENFLEILYETIAKHNVGLGVCGYDEVIENSLYSIRKYGYNGIVKKQKLYCDLFGTGYLMGYLVNKIFITDIIQKYQLLMNEELKICEDQEFCYRYFSYIDEAYCSKQICYHYVKRTGNATSPEKNDDYGSKQQVNTKNALKALDLMQNYDCKYRDTNLKYIQLARAGMMCNCIVECIRVHVLPEEYKQYQAFVRKELFHTLSWKGMNFNRKILMIAVAIHWKVAWILSVLLEKYRTMKN